MSPEEIAKEYLYDLHNNADHINNLVRNAKHASDEGRFDDAVKWLEQAKEPAEKTLIMVKWALDHLRVVES